VSLLGRSRYPDDVFFAILDEVAEAGRVQGYSASGLAIASGTVEKTKSNASWAQAAKWCCRIDRQGIRHLSEIWEERFVSVVDGSSMWYAAHAVFYFKLIGQSQDSFLVHENIYIISAADSGAARAKAEIIGRANEDAGDDGHLELNEKKASYVFAGIRKIVEAETTPSPEDAPLATGHEVTYSVLEVDTLDEVLALARGEMVAVLYRE
jgi:hypothetical protein